MWLGDTICAVKHRVLSEQIFGAMESHVAGIAHFIWLQRRVRGNWLLDITKRLRPGRIQNGVRAGAWHTWTNSDSSWSCAALQKVTLDADEVPLRANEESITGKIAWMMMSLWILTVPWPLAPLYGWKSMGIAPMLALTLSSTLAVTEKFFVSVADVAPLQVYRSTSNEERQYDDQWCAAGFQGCVRW